MKTQTITKFDSKNLDELRPVIQDALSVLEKYGLTTTLGKITYDATNFSAKLEVVTGGNGEHQFKQYASMFNLKPGWFGKTFELKGDTYKIVGLDPGKHKFPVVLLGPDTKTVTFTADGVRAALGDAKQVKQEQYREYRNNFITSTFLDDKLNCGWLGKQIVNGNQKLTIIGSTDGRSKKVILEGDGGKLFAPKLDSFLAVLQQKDNKHLLNMKKGKC